MRKVERNREWVRERNRAWVREGSRRNYVGNGYDHQAAVAMLARRREGERKNWRDATGVSSFYFTQFSEKMK